MAEKKLTTRIQQKADSKANWDKAVNFVPLKGEYIYYSDLNMVRVGDGVKKLSELSFIAQPTKTLNTNNTAAQVASANEAIAGSGTINLHKVSKTGSYDDLNNKPTLLKSGKQTATSTVDGGSNVYTFTDTSGATSTFTVKNGSKGSTGPQGPVGPTGPGGVAAGFGNVRASVDANIGTPSVTVSATGPDMAKSFIFAFKNLKGLTGPQGLRGLSTTKKKLEITRGNLNSSSYVYLKLGTFKSTSDTRNGGAVHIYGWIGTWAGSNARTSVDVVISTRDGLAAVGRVSGIKSGSYDIFVLLDQGNTYRLILKMKQFTAAQLSFDYDDWDEFGGFTWELPDNYSSNWISSVPGIQTSCYDLVQPEDKYYGSYSHSDTGNQKILDVAGGPNGSIVTVIGKVTSSQAGGVALQRQTTYYTDYDAVAISHSVAIGVTATGFVPPNSTYHCFMIGFVSSVYVHVFNL